MLFNAELFWHDGGMPYANPEDRRAYEASPKARYKQHRGNIRAQGISFEISFEEWWRLWQESGKWELRGFRTGEYYMTRIDISRGFEIGNIEIIQMVKDPTTVGKAQKRYRERHHGEPFRLYQTHINNAYIRGIPFRMTFEEWWNIWQESGKWEQRGNRSDQYCMARFNDLGAYEIGNIEIVLNYKNRSDRNRNYPMIGEDNPAFGKNYWAGITDEERQRRVAMIKGRPKKRII